MIVPGESTFTEVLEVSQFHLPSWASENQADFQEPTGRTYVLDIRGSPKQYFVSHVLIDWRFGHFGVDSY
jgi:hypothetical protein